MLHSIHATNFEGLNLRVNHFELNYITLRIPAIQDNESSKAPRLLEWLQKTTRFLSGGPDHF
jgi:hypothetical protein